MPSQLKKYFAHTDYNWTSDSGIFNKKDTLIDKIHSKQRKNSITYQQQKQHNDHTKNLNTKSQRVVSSVIQSPNVSKNAKNLQKSRNYHHQNSHSRSNTSLHSNQSINKLRSAKKQEEQKSQNIQNRLKYLQTQKQRQQRLLNVAKKKYMEVNQIRDKSFNEKISLEKERKSLIKSHQRQIQKQAELIKSKKHLSGDSQSKVELQKRKQAEELRKQKLLNEELIASKRQREQSKRKQRVKSAQNEAAVSRERTTVRNEQKVKRGIVNHKKLIEEELSGVHEQMKRNQRLMKHFKTEALKIYDKKTEQQEKLETFRGFLRLNKSNLHKRLNLVGGQGLQTPKAAERPKTVEQRVRSTGIGAGMGVGLSPTKRRVGTALTATTNSQFANRSKLSSARQSEGRAERQQFYLTNPE